MLTWMQSTVTQDQNSSRKVDYLFKYISLQSVISFATHANFSHTGAYFPSVVLE